MTSKKFNAIIAGGGTGGHLYPAIAIGEEIKYRAPNVNNLAQGIRGCRRNPYAQCNVGP